MCNWGKPPTHHNEWSAARNNKHNEQSKLWQKAVVVIDQGAKEYYFSS